MRLAVDIPRSPATRGRPATAGLRQRIIDAAAAIFASHDYHEVLMDGVARQCGVSKGTLYRYFPSKRALYLGVMFEGMDRLHEALRAAADGRGAPVRRLARLAHALLDHFWDRRLFIALIHRNEHRPGDAASREWERRRSQIAHLVQSLLEEAVAAGELRPIDTRVGAEMLLGMLRGVHRYRRADDTLPELVGAVLDVFLRGTGTDAGRRALASARQAARPAGNGARPA